MDGSDEAAGWRVSGIRGKGEAIAVENKFTIGAGVDDRELR